MKLLLPITLGLACIALVISLIVTKNGADARQEADAGTIADFSNHLATAQSQIAAREASLLACSNSLDEAHATALAFSNHLTEAQSALAIDSEQITNLARQVATAQTENHSLDRHVAELTNQVAGLHRQLALTTASLTQTNQDLVVLSRDYALLDNRFRIDVAERTVIERRFNNPTELQAQIQNLKLHPPLGITTATIYAGLNVEVKSNGWCHVITPN